MVSAGKAPQIQGEKEEVVPEENNQQQSRRLSPKTRGRDFRYISAGTAHQTRPKTTRGRKRWRKTPKSSQQETAAIQDRKLQRTVDQVLAVMKLAKRRIPRKKREFHCP
ncbi:hypothetical protein KCP74_16465 [Salmonella enterica subsp. enterica]|nr:hypothetical protein KCP74_16465 [Salmonella enterica subsp. enterica]